tara:strand:- start:101 stop:796 length:696 start_codon:yes stop_codon:yes gene_type:complete
MKLTDIETFNAEQTLFDAFNGFMLSSDLKVFGKLLARTLLFNQVKDIPGDIVECGVFKGTGLLTFLKLKRYFCPNTHKQVVGFDFYNTRDLVDSLSGYDKEAMDTMFKDRGWEHEPDFRDYMEQKIKDFGFKDYEFELIAGDVCKTTYEFVEDRPGAKISLLYIDVDLDVPTYEILNAMWDRVSSGGIVVFDDYAYQRWTMSPGADRFFEDKGIQVQSLNYMAPTAYVIKP